MSTIEIEVKAGRSLFQLTEPTTLREVEAEIFGPLAVHVTPRHSTTKLAHPGVDKESWTITHIESGKSLSYGLQSYETARDSALALVEEYLPMLALPADQLLVHYQELSPDSRTRFNLLRRGGGSGGSA